MTILKKGDKGPLVINLQKQLNRFGYLLGTDGVFGAKTEKAVKDFQKKNKLKVDGIVGPSTNKALLANSRPVKVIKNRAEIMLDVCRSQIGYKETPPNSNKTKYGEWYKMNGQPWCDMFISWCAKQAGLEKEVGKFAYTPAHAKWFKDKKQWGTTPKAGAIVFFRFGFSVRINHVGIVEKINSDGSIGTIEGNTAIGNDRNGGSVVRRTRKGKIVGYGYPAY